MPEVIEQSAETVADTAPKSETVVETVQTGATDVQTSVAETDEQKNQRVAREAQEKAEKRSRGVQKRIDELTAEKHAERKRADDLQALLARTIGQPVKAEAKTGEPTRDPNDSYEEHLVKLAEYRAEQRTLAILAESNKTQAAERAREAAEQSSRTIANAFNERQNDFAKSTPDYFEVMEDADIAVPTSVLHSLAKIPDGPLIAYNMAKNPDLAKQFTVSNADQHGYLLGQLAATLKAPQNKTNAPAAGKTVSSKAGSDNEPPSDPEKYRAWADKHLK